MTIPLFLAGVLLLAPTTTPPATGPRPAARTQAVGAVLLRPSGLEPAALLEALELRSPQRALAVPPWPDAPAERFELYAVATVSVTTDAVAVSVVLSDGRAYDRTLPASAEDAPRVAASAIANLVAAIEEDELPPDREDVPLPPEQEPTTTPPAPAEPEPEPPEPTVVAPPRTERPPEPLELEAALGGTVGLSVGPPAPTGWLGGGALGLLDLRWPTGPLVSLAVRSHWLHAEPLTVGRTRISVGGGYAWRWRRLELRAGLGLDVEPWGVRRDGARQTVLDPDGQRRARGVQVGGHLRVRPGLRLPLGPTLALVLGPRVELAGSVLGTTAGVARLLVAEAGSDRGTAVTRVGGLELSAGVELGLAWSLPRR